MLIPSDAHAEASCFGCSQANVLCSVSKRFASCAISMFIEASGGPIEGLAVGDGVDRLEVDGDSAVMALGVVVVDFDGY